MTDKDRKLMDEILKIKDKNPYIIAHYYQRPEIQDIADFVGIPMLWRFKPKSSL